MNREYKCPRCKKGFTTRRGLHIHIGEMHQGDKENLFKKEKELNGENGIISTGGFWNKYGKRIRVGISILVFLLFITTLYQTFTPDTPVQGEEVTPDEAAEFLKDSIVARHRNADISIEESLEDHKELYTHKIRVENEITGEIDYVELYTTKDAYYLFSDKISTGEREVSSVGEAGIIGEKSLQEELSRRAEENGDINDISVKFTGEGSSEDYVYSLKMEVSSTGLPKDVSTSYLTKTGDIIFLEGFKTGEVSEIVVS